jgi:hypothetical protein
VGEARSIVVRPIAAADANRIVRALHYSGKVVRNSQLHFGVFKGGRCGGAMQFGPPLDKRKLIGLVAGTPWNGFVELNRMAFAAWLPRNSESRALGVVLRLMRKNYPHLKWVVSFADATQCGDGAIYRAAGFVLTAIKPNNQIWALPGGDVMTRLVATDTRMPARGRLLAAARRMETGAASMRPFVEAGARPLPGFQLRYVYFLDPAARDRLTVPVLPFSRIAEMGAAMYRGRPRAGSADSGTPANHAGGGGANPTPALAHTENGGKSMRPVAVTRLTR